MKILIACEYSGIVRDAFIKKGHQVISCDLLPTESKGPHYQGDVLDILYNDWDMIIAFPPCTYLTVTGNRWFNIEKYGEKAIKRHIDRKEAINFFMMFVNANCKRIAIENPIGIMSTEYRKPDQIIQPYQFGDPFEKKTCLWLKGLKKLKPTKIVKPPPRQKIKGGKTLPVWYSNAPKKERSKIRSKTFPGIAEAMANQWSEQMNDRQWICRTHQNIGKKGSLPKECTKKQGCVFNKRYIPIQTKLF